MDRKHVASFGKSDIYEESQPNGRGGWTFVGYYVSSPRGNDRQFPDRQSAESYAYAEDAAIPDYYMVRRKPSGEIFALRCDNFGAITGVCGPLHHTEQDAPGADYEYDTDPDVLAEWMSVGSDAPPTWDYENIRDL